MLGTVTPLGERSRGYRWLPTFVLFGLSATLSGASVGFALSRAGSLMHRAGLATSPRFAAALVPSLIVVGACLQWLARDSLVPHFRRQVDDMWLQRYRRWIYATGFGAQLGVGFATHVKSALFFSWMLSVLVVGDISLGVLSGAVFGAIRGGQLLVVMRVANPVALVRIHLGLRRYEIWARKGLAAVAIAAACTTMAIAYI